MFVINKMWKSLLILFLVAFLSISYASAATDTFEEYAEDSHFIAGRGNSPDTVDQEWKNAMRDCWLNITKEVGPSYSEFDSSINSFGGGNDILNVYIGSAYEGQINDSRIDEMYQNIESYCEENCGINDVPVVFMWDEDEEDMPLPDYGPEIFEKAANSSGFVASKGTMPVITDASEKRDWLDLLTHCARGNKEINNYFRSSGGPLLSFGNYIDGYLEVGLNSATPEKVNESVIDEIYQTIDEAAEEEGVSNVPVVFVWTVGYDNTIAVESPFVEEDLKNESTQDNEDSTRTTSGFTSIMLILCLLIMACISK
ncbi:hypothetical protein [uncultured Methanolobus sp.]|uniref:hypothetical protein n=1 Tax=uncultured Methanolobus sp. TaxID=218300 RepID=UPI002AAA8BB7|nr:hypothetical protein [uncultured Methanolobus sp.]